MEKLELIKEVKKLTGRADLEGALQLLDDFTLSDAKYDELHDRVVQTQAQLSQLQKDQNAGVISFENAKLSLNQVTRQILAILDELEAEEKPFAQKPGRKRLIFLLSASVLMVALGSVGAYWWMNREKSPGVEEEENPTTVSSFCADFDEPDAEFRVLILPYYSFSVSPIRTHIGIRLRLGDLRDKYFIKLESEVYGDSTLARSDKYPANSEEAGRFVRTCSSDYPIDMVIWGTEDQLDDDRKFITTKYRLLGHDNFNLTKLKISDTDVDTIRSLSSILTQGEVTGEIEQIIKFLFGLIKYETGDYNDAIAALEEAESKQLDSNAQLTKSMLLFDSYIQQNDENRALTALDSALATHPEYALALNNRAAIYFKRKNFEAAAADMEVANEKLPEDPTIVSNRLRTSLAVEKIYTARESLNKLEELTREETTDLKNKDLVAKTPVVIDNIKRRQESVIEKTQDILERDPGNIEALQEQAETYLKQGNFQDAVKLADQMLKVNPRQRVAYLILLEAYIELKREREIVETIRRAVRNGIDKNALLEGRNDLRMAVDKLTLLKK